jgi:hypothetical protein
MGNPSPLGVLLKKLCNFKANFLHQPFCKPLWLVPSWALTLKKIQSYCFSRNQPNTVCLFSSDPACQFFAFSGPVCLTNIFSSLICLAFFV